MTYQPKPGDIGITTISGAGGLAIRVAQWLDGGGFANREHAFVVSRVDDDGTVWIAEAMPGGAQEVANWHPDAVYLRCPDELRAGVATWAARFADRKYPYSWLDYAAITAHRLHIPAPGLRDFIRTSRHMICSQLADRAAKYGGWRLFDDDRWDGFVTPADLYALYLEQHAVRQLNGDSS